MSVPASACVFLCLHVCVNFHKTRRALITSAKLIFTLASLGFEVAPSKYRCVLNLHTCAQIQLNCSAVEAQLHLWAEPRFPASLSLAPEWNAIELMRS